MDYLNLSKNELLTELSLGRELEFHIGENAYFIGLSEKQHYIWSEEKQRTIFNGPMELLSVFRFPEGISLERDFEKFIFDYLL